MNTFIALILLFASMLLITKALEIRLKEYKTKPEGRPARKLK